MQRSTMEFRLGDLSDGDGEIELERLALLAKHVHEFALRTARWLAGSPGPGRTSDAVARSARLTLTRLEPGSTVLEFAAPTRPDGFPLGTDLADLSDRVVGSMGDAFIALEAGLVPSTSEPAVESLRGLLGSIDGARLQTVTRVPGSSVRTARLVPRLALTVFDATPIEPPLAGESDVFSGRLYSIDVDSGHFRIKDDLGTSILLHLAGEPLDVADLVGGQVDVSGVPSYDASGRLLRVEDAVVSKATGWDDDEFRSPTDVEALVAAAQPFDPDVDGISGMDVDEVDALLAALNA